MQNSRVPTVFDSTVSLIICSILNNIYIDLYYNTNKWIDYKRRKKKNNK